MSKKHHRMFACDGYGYTNNQRACVEYATDMGLRWDQYDVIQEEATNECQTAALYVTDAAKAKIDKIRREQIENCPPYN